MNKILKKDDLLKLQKNQGPFLMMDEIELISESEVKGKKLFDKNFWIFEHHWPNDPNVPAVFQIETLMQISSMIILSQPEFNNKTFLVVRSNNLKFKKKITPGMTLNVYSKMISFNRGLARFSASGTVENVPCCSGEFTMILQDNL